MNFSDKQDPDKENIKFILELFNSNRFVEAKKEIKKQMKIYSNSSVLYNIQGAIFAAEDNEDFAIDSYEMAKKINPNYAQVYNNLGIIFQKQGKFDEAIENYKKAIDLKKDFAEPYNNLGVINIEKDNSENSIEFFNKAIHLNPNYAEAYYNLGVSYSNLSNFQKSLESFTKATEIRPNYFEAHNYLGNIFSKLSDFDNAILNFNKAIDINYNYEKSHNNLGNLFGVLGEFEKSYSSHKKALKIKPDNAQTYSNLLFYYLHRTDFQHDFYLQEVKKFRISSKTIKKKISLKYQYNKNPNKLRLGLVSSDFGNHPGGYFTLSTLKELNKKNFELVAYSNFDRKDEYYNQFRSLFIKWNSISKKSDEDVVNQIIKDGIHILIDLQGHSAFNRLPIFIYKPAPIQATWLGQGSTGIPEIDYFIGSSYITPETEDKNYIEEVIRLPKISQCFTPPNLEIKVNELPALKNNFVTFGCLNKILKVNDEVIKVWSKILLSVINSKLILKSKELDDKKFSNYILKKFEKNGVKSENLIFLGETKTRRETLEVYNQIDIALDPFPFQGVTNTCESIWMGVPVLILKGNRYVFNFGESINANLNMSEWIAKDEKDYVSKAIKFTNDIKKISLIRKDLRDLIINSPVCDSINLSKHFSEMLWDKWKKFSLK
tara:strand:- start:306 stop:2285 length:1980 start_codon:yes stop_codon:yes gene_type:complete